MIQLVSSQRVVPLVAQNSFFEDAVDWFRMKRSGHMAKWLFSSPKFADDKACGAVIWEKVISDAKAGSPYYVFNDEQKIITAALPLLRKYLKSSLTLVDLGPGSKDAIESKTCPIISELNGLVRQYISIDTNQEFLNSASQVISNLYPEVAYGELCLDFLEDSFRYPSKEPMTVALLFGITLCNMLIDPYEKGLPSLLLASYFSRLRTHFGTSPGYLVITQDTNQDKKKLNAAYGAISDYFFPLLHRIPRDLDVFGDYDPEGFSLQMNFIEDTKAFSVSFVADRDMRFTVNGMLINLSQGDVLPMGNTFKFDKNDFLSIAQKAGFAIVETVEQLDNPCILHIMKVQ